MTFRNFTFVGWSWSAVFAGVIAALVFQVLMVMIGLGLGMLSVDVPTAESAPKAVSWAVFAWWAVSGVMSAFLGGWVAANFSDTFTAEGRATHGLMAWALATLIVVGSAAFAGTGSFATNLMGPAATTMAQYNRLSGGPPVTTGQTRPTQSQLEQARRIALAMIGSFVALLVGAGAAIAGSQWLPDARTRDVRMP
jgi:hypothetical protein